VNEAESISVHGQQVKGVDRETSRGVGVRVLVNGSWGFAATVCTGRAEVAAAARRAVEVAKASATTQRAP
jgi:TldD protein